MHSVVVEWGCIGIIRSTTMYNGMLHEKATKIKCELEVRDWPKSRAILPRYTAWMQIAAPALIISSVGPTMSPTETVAKTRVLVSCVDTKR